MLNVYAGIDNNHVIWEYNDFNYYSVVVLFFLILMDPFLLPWLPPVDIIFPFLFLSHDISHSMF